jgi:hypothetical protein
MHKGGNPLPPHPYRGLKRGNDDKSSKTQCTHTPRRSIKNIIQKKKNKKCQYASGKVSLVFH